MRCGKVLVITVILGATCGVPKEKYQAAVDEAGRNLSTASDARQRAEACEAKARETEARTGSAEKRAAELTERLSELEKAASAASADASRQREPVAELAKSKELLEAQSASASAAAERQRKLAEQLAEEKSALQAKSKEYGSLAASLDSEIKAGAHHAVRATGEVDCSDGRTGSLPLGVGDDQRRWQGDPAEDRRRLRIGARSDHSGRGSHGQRAHSHRALPV